MLKTLVKWMAKTAEDSAKEATKNQQDQHILLKVQGTDLLTSKLRTRPYKDYFQYIVQYVMGRIV